MFVSIWAWRSPNVPADRSGDYPLQAVPRLFVILLLLALDPSTSSTSRLQILSLLENLVASLPDSDEGNVTVRL